MHPQPVEIKDHDPGTYACRGKSLLHGYPHRFCMYPVCKRNHSGTGSADSRSISPGLFRLFHHFQPAGNQCQPVRDMNPILKPDPEIFRLLLEKGSQQKGTAPILWTASFRL